MFRSKAWLHTQYAMLMCKVGGLMLMNLGFGSQNPILLFSFNKFWKWTLFQTQRKLWYDPFRLKWTWRVWMWASVRHSKMKAQFLTVTVNSNSTNKVMTVPKIRLFIQQISVWMNDLATYIQTCDKWVCVQSIPAINGDYVRSVQSHLRYGDASPLQDIFALRWQADGNKTVDSHKTGFRPIWVKVNIITFSLFEKEVPLVTVTEEEILALDFYFIPLPCSSRLCSLGGAVMLA